MSVLSIYIVLHALVMIQNLENQISSSYQLLTCHLQIKHVYSTLLFVISQAQKLNIDMPCITFDQPLWYKANEIILEKNLDIVNRLGGFHTL